MLIAFDLRCWTAVELVNGLRFFQFLGWVAFAVVLVNMLRVFQFRGLAVMAVLVNTLLDFQFRRVLW
jgi:hypothetical protein